jgi:hypothetical protein
VLILVYTNAFSQNYLEFIENKGQWDKQVKFKGDIGAGSFLLQSTGYRVVLYNKEDMNRVGESMHRGVKPAETRSLSSVSKPLPQNQVMGKGARGLRMVLFLCAGMYTKCVSSMQTKIRRSFPINRRLLFPIILSGTIQQMGQ